MQTALITGVAGQDGSYLADLLLEKGYTVYGMYVASTRMNSSQVCLAFDNIKHLHGNKQFIPVSGNLMDLRSVEIVIEQAKPDEIYNLAAQSHVKRSETEPEVTRNTNAYGVDRILYAARKIVPNAKFYQASTSEMFGNAKAPQDENTPFAPVSPYGEAKLFAHQLVKDNREKGFFTVGGILFNHESERRGMSFVTRKITYGLAGIKLGFENHLSLGNLDAKRDWGHSKDYVRAMWLMLQNKTPIDYVISTGETHSVREFIEAAAQVLDINIEWKGAGVEEIGMWNNKPIIKIDQSFYRTREINVLCGNSAKAQNELGWKPEIGFKKLAEMMTKNDLSLRNKQGY
ncbi:MAG: GDP-mannose 4,6-dehydratase [Candidatus Aenigmarchaeota archaeon]|nr:GDP-mannose 4,6-dehydratase [Candidatus Aenigmarchaeota archaeon]